MKKRWLLALLLATLLVPAASADLFDPARPLLTIATEHFTFIYPEDVAGHARYLASVSEEVFRGVAGDLGQGKAEWFGNIPVVLTPDAEVMNGYTTVLPSFRIVLYLSPLEQEGSLGNFDENLKKLFMHELTHAVSMGIRSPFWQGMTALFGDVAGPNVTWRMPYNMIEGVTVSFESRNGFGRATDPAISGVIRQDIVEGRFRSFDQTAGSWDTYPAGNLCYWYGGLFSAWLQERFGMERYAALWKEGGTGNLLTDFRGLFRSVYRMDLDAAWEEWRKFMTPKTPVVACPGDTGTGYGIYPVLTARAGMLYYLDRSRSAVFSRRLDTGRETRLFDADSTVDTLDVSPDGRRLLVSRARTADSLPRLEVLVFDLAARRFLPGATRHLREAVWFDGGILGIAPRASDTDLVLVQGKTRRVLLQGHEGLAFGSPRAADGGEICFIMNERGRRSIARLDPSTGRVAVLGAGQALAHVRDLSVDGGRLLCAVCPDGEFFRLAVVEGDTVRIAAAPLSGGVFSPVAAGRPGVASGSGPTAGDGAAGLSPAVWYVGRFSRGDRLLSYPDTPAAGLAGAGKAEWLPWRDTAALPGTHPAETVAEAREAEGPGDRDNEPPGNPSPAGTESTGDNTVATEGGKQLSAGGVKSAAGTQDFAVRPYSPFPWIFRTIRLPLLYPAADAGSIRAAGVMLIGEDPIERNAFTVAGAWDWQSSFLELDGSWVWSPAPVAFTLHGSDSLATGDRVTALTLATAWSAPVAPSWRKLTLSGSAGSRWIAPFASGSPYAWVSGAPFLTAGGTVTFSNLATNPLPPLDESGFSLSAGCDVGTRATGGNPLTDAAIMAEAKTPAVPLTLAVQGMVANAAFLTPSGAGPFDARTTPHPELVRSFPSGACFDRFLSTEVSVRIFSFEIQQGVHAIDLYLNRFFSTAGYRAFVVPGFLAHSVFLRESLTASPLIGVAATFTFTGYVEMNYEFTTKKPGINLSGLLQLPLD